MAKGKQGFASNPDKINRGGRPKGSKSKDTTKEAIRRLDANKISAAQVFVDVVSGKDPSKDTDLKVTDMMKAAQVVLTMPEALRKGLDSKESEEEEKGTEVRVSDNENGDKVVALVQMRPNN
tara:strand:- start:53142 stop:53507 length:366 start_codon:yes stop_codon:yes gene_type:complete